MLPAPTDKTLVQKDKQAEAEANEEKVEHKSHPSEASFYSSILLKNLQSGDVHKQATDDSELPPSVKTPTTQNQQNLAEDEDNDNVLNDNGEVEKQPPRRTPHSYETKTEKQTAQFYVNDKNQIVTNIYTY